MIEYTIKQAFQIPHESNKQRLYAVITDKKGNIISEGSNTYSKSHPIQFYYAEKVGRGNAIFLHAEMNAIVRIIRSTNRRKPHSIYVARVNCKGEPVMAKPCEICEMAIEEAGIENVYYTTNS